MTHERFVCDPAIMMGKPLVRGTWITVEAVLRLLRQGRKVVDVYPDLNADDVHAARAFAADFLEIDRQDSKRTPACGGDAFIGLRRMDCEL